MQDLLKELRAKGNNPKHVYSEGCLILFNSFAHRKAFLGVKVLHFRSLVAWVLAWPIQLMNPSPQAKCIPSKPKARQSHQGFALFLQPACINHNTNLGTVTVLQWAAWAKRLLYCSFLHKKLLIVFMQFIKWEREIHSCVSSKWINCTPNLYFKQILNAVPKALWASPVE